jgi:hypothetical protein
MLGIGLFLLLAACGMPSKQQRVQEAAYELNMGTRFSRTDVAMEKVLRSERVKFTERHKLWHTEIKIVDIELAGVTFRDDGDATLFLAVSWHRANEPDMRSTVVSQKWHDKQGTWMLAAEERAQGDFGLFGDFAPPSTTGDPQKAARGDMQFRTTTIRGDLRRSRRLPARSRS